jgi:hypothetical protein
MDSILVRAGSERNTVLHDIAVKSFERTHDENRGGKPKYVVVIKIVYRAGNAKKCKDFFPKNSLLQTGTNCPIDITDINGWCH